MDSLTETCSVCQRTVGEDRFAGLTYCSRCGATLPPLRRTPIEDPVGLDPEGPKRERRRTMISFWVLFVLTPFATMLVGFVSAWLSNVLSISVFHLVPIALQVCLTFATGLFASGYCLAKLRTPSPELADLVAGTLLYGFCLIFAYLAVALGGCAVGAAVSGLYNLLR